MYRILATLCAVVTLLALAGCGGPGPAANTTTAPGDIALTPTETPPPADGTPTAEAMTPTEAEMTPTAEGMTPTEEGTPMPTDGEATLADEGTATPMGTEMPGDGMSPTGTPTGS
jgi:hypothetical protein